MNTTTPAPFGSEALLDLIRDYGAACVKASHMESQPADEQRRDGILAQIKALQTWQPMATAPRDAHIIRLLVEFEDHSLDDDSGPVQTIGHNNFDHDGVDQWQFVGWCWEHDHYTQGVGKPIGWAYLTIPSTAALQRPDLRQSAIDVIAERTRQIVTLGRDAKHDDETSDDGDLASAAAAYALNAACQLNPYMQAPLAPEGELPQMWPAGWQNHDWKPKDPRRDLVRAGALVLAEVDRIDRAAAASQPSGDSTSYHGSGLPL